MDMAGHGKHTHQAMSMAEFNIVYPHKYRHCVILSEEAERCRLSGLDLQATVSHNPVWTDGILGMVLHQCMYCVIVYLSIPCMGRS